MRLRRDPRAEQYIQESDIVISNPEEYKGKWHTLFDNNNKLHVEFGMGKGGFIIELAKQNPHINYIGVERFETVVYKACKKAEREEVSSNLRYLFYNVESCADIFEAGEVDRIYLNFSDPWPKNRHANKRLTYYKFLEKYQSILNSQGELHFKTDNKGLFEFSLNEISKSDWKMKNITLDLHASDIKNNIMTEYEARFSAMGMPIYRLECFPRK
ncbi:MAG TPA: tRNA (guanosine(46)-N7)-methyltransferase TrmB [Epulopiscium sp.]|nr:tRNA (guanosine(46)-N7)-methyltransferase TrmB [Candidatus Epulonipiscium sp.]